MDAKNIQVGASATKEAAGREQGRPIIMMEGRVLAVEACLSLSLHQYNRDNGQVERWRGVSN